MAAELLQNWAPRYAREINRAPLLVQRELDDAALDAEVMAKNLVGKRTRQLMRSIEGRREGYRIRLSAQGPYAAIQEYGGTVRGRPFLAVPLTADARAKGRARNDPNLFVIRVRGRAFLVRREGRRLEFRWLLLPQVTIKAHPYLGPAMDMVNRSMPMRMERVWMAVNRAV
jgi:hypothetical protein